jgi:2-desacetyl-2-hydroxyethyl bacteriochlorophyllide A dehydrogenase
MKTIVLDQPGHFTLTETTPPGDPAPGEALVRVHRVGICGTDLHAYRGKMPFLTYPRILGHELGVEIVAIGENDRGLRVGDRCSVEPYLNCGKCIACRRGKTNCCATLQTLGVHTDGGMREYINLPVRKLHKSDKLSLDALALVETLCIGAHAVRRATLDVGETALVIGAGPIGLTVIEALKHTGANIIVMDIAESRLDFVQRQLGVEHAVNARDNVFENVRALTQGDLPTAVFDATGNGQSMKDAFQYVAPGGKLVYVGLFQGDVTFHDPDFHRKEDTLMGSRNATPSDFAWVIEQLESGVINTSTWITHRAAFDSMIASFENWLDPANGVIKAMTEW